MVSDGMPNIDDPRTIREASFSTSFRGFDQLEVRAFLQTLARQLTDIDDFRAEAQAKIEQAQRELEAAKEIDESVLMERLGDDATRILQTARDSAGERLAQADHEIAELRSRVDAEVAAMRQAAEDQAAVLQKEVAAQQATLDAAIASEAELREKHRSEALMQTERDVEDLLATARAQGDQVLADAREEGRAMVAEARIVRERILADLSRRRTNAKVQLEQLRAGRQRLLEAIEVASAAVADVNRELDNSLPEARLAAETAGLTVPTPASVAEIESEIESARLVGNPFVTADEVEQSLAAGHEKSADPIEAPASDDGDRDNSHAADAPEHDSSNDEPEQEKALEGPDAFDSPGVVLAELGEDRSPMFRRKKYLPPVADELPRDEVPTVELEADFEQVRALDPTMELEPVVEETRESPEPIVDSDESIMAAEADEVDHAAHLDVEQCDGDDASEPKETEVDTVVALDVEQEHLEENLSADTDVADGVSEGGVPEGGVPEDGIEATESAPEEEAVDALFERLRADREERTAHASAVLAAADAPKPSAPSSEPLAPTEIGQTVHEPVPPLEAVPTLANDPDSAEPDDQGSSSLSAPVSAPLASERFQNLERALAARQSSVAEFERSIGRKLKRSLAEEQNELLDLVRREGVERDATADDLLGDIATHSARYIGSVASQLQSAADAGATSVGGKAPSVDPERASLVVADELLANTRLLVQRVVADNDDSDDVIEHLRSLYREVKGQRMSGVASSLVVSAYNEGVHAGLAAERMVRWELAPDSECGDDCSANLVAGTVVAGDAFPSGHLHPPAGPGCRCLLVAEEDVVTKKIS